MTSAKRTAGGLAVIVLASLAFWLAPPTAGAQHAPSGGPPPVAQEGDDIVGRIRSQADMLNSGSPGGGGPPPTCSWTDFGAGPNGENVERTDGTPRWRDPGQGHDFWAEGWEESEGEVVGDGTIYRYECWHPDMGCSSPAPSGNGCLGQPISETWCGSFLCLFDAISPAALARLAVDEFIQTLGPPNAAFSPAGETLVNFPTYMWLTNPPPAGQAGPWTMSVPGISVTAWATSSDITWAMGDGNSVECPITSDEASARAAGCSYVYQTSSALQPDLVYAGEVSMTWLVEWTVNGAGGGSLDAPRSNPFTLGVAEAQAINTGD